MPEHVLMSEIEIITEGGGRRRWSAAEKLRIVEKTLDEGASISVVPRRKGVGAGSAHTVRLRSSDAVRPRGTNWPFSTAKITPLEKNANEINGSQKGLTVTDFEKAPDSR